MFIYLKKEEWDYLYNAIDLWHKEALQHIERMKNYNDDNDDYDGYDPLPPGKCAYLTEGQRQRVKLLTASMEVDWANNEGKINLDLYKDLFFKYSVHPNMQSPLLLRIDKKISQAMAASKLVLQTQSVFAAPKEQYIPYSTANPLGAPSF